VGRLDGKVAVVTGAGRGIGRGEALLLAAEGASVVVNDVDRAAAEAVVDEIAAAGGKGLANSDDVSTWSGGGDVVRTAVEELGGLDVLVNNAGTGDPTGEFLKLSYEEWMQVIDTNLSGAFLCSQRAARRMVEAGNGGRIINITSVHEHIPRTGASAYCSAKGGLGLLTKVMAMELAGYGITVNAVAPGEIATPMTGAEDTDPGTIERPNLPLGRPGHAREIAAWVAFLASEKSSYATGASLVVDGGLMLMAAELSS
jgi:NAD(P)-dependent dehydrogenase (short-subunit alcohol dehydrogenase family)